MARQAGPEPEVYRITGAQQAHSVDMGQRMGRYLISMLIRTVCIILVLVPSFPWFLRVAFGVAAVVLPYIAVVMANAGQARRDDAPPTVRTDRVRSALGTGSGGPTQPPTTTGTTRGTTPAGSSSGAAHSTAVQDDEVLVGEVLEVVTSTSGDDSSRVR